MASEFQSYIISKFVPSQLGFLRTLFQHRADKESWSHEELPVNIVCSDIGRKLKVERACHRGRGRVFGAHRSVGHVEQCVVVREEEVADGKEDSSNGSDTVPAIKFLNVQIY